MVCIYCSSAQAAYLAKAGKSVAVFERRHILGGAAVTEEIITGFKFSRASYLISLLRPQIVKELELKVPLLLSLDSSLILLNVILLQKHGLKIYLRNPNSFTPLLGTDKYLLLGSDEKENKKEVAKFSSKDAVVCR